MEDRSSESLETGANGSTHIRKKGRKDRAGRRLPSPPHGWRLMAWEYGTSGPDITSCERS